MYIIVHKQYKIPGKLVSRYNSLPSICNQTLREEIDSKDINKIEKNKKKKRKEQSKKERKQKVRDTRIEKRKKKKEKRKKVSIEEIYKNRQIIRKKEREIGKIN